MSAPRRALAGPDTLTAGPGGLRALNLGRWSVLLDPRSVLVCLLLAAALVLALVAAVLVGEHPMPVAALARVLSGTATPAEALIIGDLRAPRVLTGAVVGLALGLAGALFQSVTRNPLGSPDVIGFDTGAATGALVAMLVAGGGVLTTALGAVAGGAGTAVAVLLLATGRGRDARHGPDALRLVLVGLGVGLGLAAFNSLLVVSSNLYDAQSAAVWLIGNLAGRDWSRLALLAPVVAVGLVLALLLGRRLAVAELGTTAPPRSACDPACCASRPSPSASCWPRRPWPPPVPSASSRSPPRRSPAGSPGPTGPACPPRGSPAPWSWCSPTWPPGRRSSRARSRSGS